MKPAVAGRGAVSAFPPVRSRRVPSSARHEAPPGRGLADMEGPLSPFRCPLPAAFQIPEALQQLQVLLHEPLILLPEAFHRSPGPIQVPWSFLFPEACHGNRSARPFPVFPVPEEFPGSFGRVLSGPVPRFHPSIFPETPCLFTAIRQLICQNACIRFYVISVDREKKGPGGLAGAVGNCRRARGMATGTVPAAGKRAATGRASPMRERGRGSDQRISNVTVCSAFLSASLSLITALNP